MKAIAIIHARGGSKRIPLKNLKLLGGKPLLAYPILLCQKLPWIERIIVSTDHEGIREEALKWGAAVPFKRPADISEDVPSELVTEHALRFFQETEKILPEFVLTLTPATPFTTSEQLQEAFDLLIKNPSWDAVTTVRKTAEHPEWMLRRDPLSGEISTLLGNPLDGKYNVSQNLEKLHYPTGSFWINRSESFLNKPSLYGSRWGAIEVDPRQTVDIDLPQDLERAEELIRSFS